MFADTSLLEGILMSALRGAVFGGILGGLLYLAIQLVRRMRKKKESNEPMPPGPQEDERAP